MGSFGSFGNINSPNVGRSGIPSAFDPSVFYLDVFGFSYGHDPHNDPPQPPEFMLTICRVNGKLWYIRHDIDPTSPHNDSFNIKDNSNMKLMITLEVMDCEAAGSFIWFNMQQRFYRVRFREGQTTIADRIVLIAIPPSVPEQSLIFEKLACIISKTVRLNLESPFRSWVTPTALI